MCRGSSIPGSIRAKALRSLDPECKLRSNRKIHFILRTDEKSISEYVLTLTRLLNAEEAPAAVVEEHRRRLKEFTAQLAKLKQAREGLK